MSLPGFTAEGSLYGKSRHYLGSNRLEHTTGAIHPAQKKPPVEVWGGVEVIGFAECMEKCEEGHDWWELWVHAYCLGKCAIENVTGGGRIFK